MFPHSVVEEVEVVLEDEAGERLTAAVVHKPVLDARTTCTSHPNGQEKCLFYVSKCRKKKEKTKTKNKQASKELTVEAFYLGLKTLKRYAQNKQKRKQY